MKRIVFSALVMIGTSACALPPSQYSAEPVSGRVVDARTREPLAGASVVALWELDGPQGFSFDLLHVEEAVTDSDGNYRIAGWGPIARPLNGHLDYHDPTLIFFKSGYAMRAMSNSEFYPPDKRVELEVRNSGWNGKTIQLVQREQKESLDRGIYVTTLLYGLGPKAGRCWWKRAPKFVAAIDGELNSVPQRATGGFSESIRISRLLERRDCAPFDDFMGAAGVSR